MTDSDIQLTYDPFALPTTQHRAGLAGLLVLIMSMRRRKIQPLPEVSKSDNGKVLVHLTKESLGSVFNDLYDATTEEVESNRKRKDKSKREIPPLHEEKKTDPKTGKQKTVYVYPRVICKARFLTALGMPDIWLKLWREAVWATLRGVPQTRRPYEQRARGETISEIDTTWQDLQKFQQKQARNEIHTVDIASSIFVGAQAWNAERVPFRGKADESFLLYFWPVVMGVYVPEVIDREGKTKFVGYVLAVPDVSHLDSFVQDFPDTMAQLGNEAAAYRPREAVISLPQEGGLEYLHHLMGLAKGKADAGDLAYSISGVEVYHLKPPDYAKNERMVRLLGTDRVAATPDLLEKYETGRGYYHNPLFKRQIILNLLRREPWHRGFDRVFSKNDRERFIGSSAGRFPMDVRRCFETGLQERRSA